MDNKKAISPVVAIALLLVVSVVAVVGYQNWYTGFQSALETDVEQRSSGASGSVNVEFISSDGQVYITNTGTSNISMSTIKIGDTDCFINQNLTPGVNNFSVSSCLNESGTNEVKLVTENGVVTESVFLESTEDLVFPTFTSSFTGTLFQTINMGVGLGRKNIHVNGDYMIGADRSNSTMFVFKKNATEHWELHQKLSPTTSFGDYGWGAHINGNYIMVGDDNGDVSYVYELNGSGYYEELYNFTSSEGSGSFGYHISIGGDYAIICEPWNSIGGKGYIYERSGSIWTNIQNITASDINTSDSFCYSATFSGNYLAVASPWEDGGAGNPELDTGAIYLFELNGSGLFEEKQIVYPDYGNGGSFEYIAMDGNYLIATDDGTQDVHFFELNGGILSQINFFDPLTNVGIRAAIDGNIGAAAGRSDDNVHIYEFNAFSNAFSYIMTVNGPAGCCNDFGDSVAVDGQYVLIGSDALSTIYVYK